MMKQGTLNCYKLTPRARSTSYDTPTHPAWRGVFCRLALLSITIFLPTLLILITPPHPLLAAKSGPNSINQTKVLGNSSVRIHAPKKAFASTDSPTFTITERHTLMSSITSLAKRLTNQENIKPFRERATVKLLDPRDHELKDVALTTPKDSEIHLNLVSSPSFTPGTYTVIIEEEGKQLSQNFSWGVLAINPNKSIYSPGETAHLAIAVLDDKGEMVCDANVALDITDPSGETATVSTSDGSIKINPDCQVKGPTSNPDYETSYDTKGAGSYRMKLTANTRNGTHELTDSFVVREGEMVEIERINATRIYPPTVYTNTLNLKFKADFEGTLVETVPDSFDIKPSLSGTTLPTATDNGNGTKSLNWSLTASLGEIISISYDYQTPGISPQFYLTGPAKLVSDGNTVAEELRHWQIANDAVASGIIVAWPGTEASIPAGWSRVAALNGKYLESTTSDPSASDLGTATHAHTDPGHTHTLPSHTHTGTTPVGSGTSPGTTTTAGTGASSNQHTHTITTASATPTQNSATANFQTAPNDPPYYEVIWIQSNGTTDIPAGAIAFFNSDTLPANWSRQAGDQFLKGAGAGSGGGATGGTSNAHTHTDSGHTHTEQTHTHTGTTGQTNDRRSGTAAVSISSGTHTHTLSGGSVTGTEGAGNALLSNGDAQPPYYKLNIIKNDNAGTDLPNNTIAIWTGTIASVPANWEVCNGSGTCPNLNDKFIKGAAADGQLSTTGGALTHTHAAGTAHNHPINTHTHSFTVDQSTTATTNRTNTPASAANAPTHNHSTWTDGDEGSGTTNTQTTSANANTDNRPPYREAVFIQYHSPGRPLAGYVRGTDESSFVGNPPCDGSTTVLSLKINGTGTATTSCDSNGYFQFTNITYAAGDTVTVYLNNNSTSKGNLVMVAGSAEITDAELFQGRIVLRDDNNGIITNEELSDWDNDNDSTNLLFTSNLSTTYNLSTETGTELHIWTSDTYDPGGTLSTNTVSGDVHLDNGSTAYLDTSLSTVGRNLTVDPTATLYIQDGAVLRGTTTIDGTLSASSNVTVTTRSPNAVITGSGSITFYNLTAGDSFTTTTLISSPITVANNLVVGTDSTLNINADTSVGGNLTNTTTGVIGTTFGTPTVTLTGSSVAIGGGSGNITFHHLTTSGTGTFTFTLGGGTNTINGNLTAGTGTTLNINGAGNLNLAGNLVNNGSIGTTSGTPTVTTTGATPTLGGGSTGITLYNLSTSGTGITSFTGSGTNLINGTVTVGTGTTLNLNSSISIAGNLVNTATGVIGYSGTPTVTLTGTTASLGGGSGSVSFYNLTVDPSSTGTVTLNSNASVANTLIIASGDTLSLTSGANLTHAGSTLTLTGTIAGSGTLIYQSGGTFPTTGSISSTLRMDATNSDQTLGTRTYGGNVEIFNNSPTSSRTISLSAGSHTFSGNLTITAANSQGVELTGATTNPTVSITGNLLFTTGGITESLTTGTGTWTVSGNVDLTGGSFTASPGHTLNMNGTSKTITSTSQPLQNFAVTGGSVSAVDVLDVNGTFSVTSGAFTQGANANLNVAGNFTLANGTTFTKASGSGLLILDGDLTLTDNTVTKQDLGNVHIGTSPDTTNLASDMTATSLTVNVGDYLYTNGYDLNLGTGGLTIYGTLDATDDVETDETLIQVDGDFNLSSGSVFTPDQSTLEFTGGAVTSNLFTVGTGSLYNLSINGSNTSLIVEVEDPLDVDNNLTISSGTFDVVSGENNSVNVGGNWDNDATFQARTGTVLFDATSGTKTIDADGTGADAFYTIQFNDGVGTASFQLTTALDTDYNLTITEGTLDGNGQTLYIGNNWSNSGVYTAGTGGTVVMDAQDAGNTLSGSMTGSSSFYNLTFDDAGTVGAWIFSAAATITNNLTVTGGSVTAPTGNLTIGGNFTNNDSFSHGSGTVIFNDNSKVSTLSYAATTTFNNLTVTTGGKQMKFENTDLIITDIDGTLVLQGSNCAAGRVFLDSEVDDDQWQIAASGTTSITQVDVEDSSASPALTANDSTADNGGNTGWTVNGGICVPPAVPNTPSNTTPADGTPNQSVNPGLTSSAFSDPNAGDTHTSSQWQVSTATGAGFDAAIVWDSGTSATNLTDIIVNAANGNFQGELLGQTTLANSTTYYWRVRQEDSTSRWSDYSPITSFTTGAGNFRFEGLKMQGVKVQ